MDLLPLVGGRRRFRIETKHLLIFVTVFAATSCIVFRATRSSSTPDNRTDEHPPMNHDTTAFDRLKDNPTTHGQHYDNFDEQFPELEAEYSHQEEDFTRSVDNALDNGNDIAAIPPGWRRHVQFTEELPPTMNILVPSMDEPPHGQTTGENTTTATTRSSAEDTEAKGGALQDYTNALDPSDDDKNASEMNMHEILQYPVEDAGVAASDEVEGANSTVVVTTSTTSEAAPVVELSTEATTGSPNVTVSPMVEAKDAQAFKEVTPPLNTAGMLVARSVGVEQQHDRESTEFSSPALSPTAIAAGPVEVTVRSRSDNGEQPRNPAQTSAEKEVAGDAKEQTTLQSLV